MKTNMQHTSHIQVGFSLIEILVGLVIGLLATLVIMQVFSVFEGQKRTTTGTSDAQTNGSIALYTIAHELQMAGYGLTPIPSAALGKTVSPLVCTAPTWGAGVTDISPVTITDGGANPGDSDSMTIRYGNSPTGAVPSLILPPVGGPLDVTVDNNMGCRVGNVAMIMSSNGATCNFTNVTGPSDIAISAVPSIPPNTTTVAVGNSSGAVENATLTCLGGWTEIVLRVNPSYDPADPANSQAYLERNGAPAVADIVNIQAQYGISNAAISNQVAQWVDASGATWGITPISTANRNRIKAIHIAVVARSGLYEKDIVTDTCTTNKGTVNNGPCAWDDTAFDAAPMIDLSNDPDWQHYRYRVFETIIPLRNMIWAKDTL